MASQERLKHLGIELHLSVDHILWRHERHSSRLDRPRLGLDRRTRSAGMPSSSSSCLLARPRSHQNPLVTVVGRAKTDQQAPWHRVQQYFRRCHHERQNLEGTAFNFRFSGLSLLTRKLTARSLELRDERIGEPPHPQEHHSSANDRLDQRLPIQYVR